MAVHRRLLLLLALFSELTLATLSARGLGQHDSPAAANPQEVFERRIMPIFRSPKPSSCVQCHLAAVDIKNYILPSHEKTFVTLRDSGLIDLSQPDKSKILTLIRMGEKDLDKGAKLIHQETRQAELEAFSAWIKACCNDPKLRELPAVSTNEQAGPPLPDEVIRHARKSRVVDSFIRNVWSQRMRCFPCHTPHEIDESNPAHEAPIQNVEKLRKEFGEDRPGRIDIFHETPEATMQYLIEASQEARDHELPLINLAEPAKSLLVLKPTSKLPAKDESGRFDAPSSVEPVTHMGGLKMHHDDQSYKSFVAWIQDYARVVGGEYTSVDDLPADNWYASKLVLQLISAPDDWPVSIPVQLFVYQWDDQSNNWASEPIAFTQGTVTPRRMVNGTLFMLGSAEMAAAHEWDGETAKLPRGKYLVKAYVDTQHRLENEPALLLGEEDFRGQAEIYRARWREGFRHAEKVAGSALTRN